MHNNASLNRWGYGVLHHPDNKKMLRRDNQTTNPRFHSLWKFSCMSHRPRQSKSNGSVQEGEGPNFSKHFYNCSSNRLKKSDSDLIIIIIAFKSAIRDFLQSPHSAANCLNMHAQVAQAQSCANRAQHIERLSRATCRFTCHLVRRDSSAIKFDRVETAFI